MEVSSWRVRIALLWAIGPVLEITHLVFTIGTEDKWKARLGSLVVHSIFFYVAPMLMCLLTLVLWDKPNRWLNLILGSFFAFVSAPIWFLEGGLGVIMYDGPTMGLEHALLLGLKCVIAVFIPWFAWKWPRRDAAVHRPIAA